MQRYARRRARAGGDHILDRGDLASIIAINFSGGGHQFRAFGFRCGSRAFFHFYEERVGFRFGDQPDNRLGGVSRGAESGEDR